MPCLKISVEVLDTFVEFSTFKKSLFIVISKLKLCYDNISIIWKIYWYSNWKITKVLMNLIILGQLLSTAYWVASGGQIIEYRDISLTGTPDRIKYFWKHFVFIGDACYGHQFANVEWFYLVTDDLKDKFIKTNRSLG